MTFNTSTTSRPYMSFEGLAKTEFLALHGLARATRTEKKGVAGWLVGGKHEAILQQFTLENLAHLIDSMFF